jgi:hypothetical protein
VADLGPPTLAVEHLAGRCVSVAGRESNVPAPHLAELGGTSFEQGSLEFGELFAVVHLDREIEPSSGGHATIMKDATPAGPRRAGGHRVDPGGSEPGRSEAGRSEAGGQP